VLLEGWTRPDLIVLQLFEDGMVSLNSVSDEDEDLDECDLGGDYDDDGEYAVGEDGLCLMDVEDTKLGL
jgi:hypothetical protein